MHAMGRDDMYPERMSEVGCLLHYVIAYLGPVAATTVFSSPDDGRRKRPKHVE